MSLDTIFINVPVKNLDKSIAFYTALGFTPHPIFRGDGACCMCINEHINIMLQTVEHFKQFTHKPIADSTQATALLLCLHCDSPAHVDQLVSAAIAAGGAASTNAKDLGFLYTHGFTDPDEYVWILNHIYPDKISE